MRRERVNAAAVATGRIDVHDGRLLVPQRGHGARQLQDWRLRQRTTQDGQDRAPRTLAERHDETWHRGLPQRTADGPAGRATLEIAPRLAAQDEQVCAL